MFAATIKTLGPRVRYASISKPIIENYAFKLHYQLTVTMLMLFVILACTKEYFGDYIKCTAGGAAPEKILNSYCFFMATYTVAGYYNETVLEQLEFSHPGIGPVTKRDVPILHWYYQWVPFVFFIQAICFYLPHYIWKKQEAGRIKLLVDGLENAILAHHEELKCKTGAIPSKENVKKKLETIKMNVLLRLRTTTTWSTWLVGMEILNFVHIVLEIWVTDYFLNGLFIGLGTSVIKFDNWENAKVTPLDLPFPKVTRCIFNKFGPGGSLQNHDALCVMTLNVMYEKLFLILWFWFLGVLVISLLAVIWRIASFFLYCYVPRFTILMFRKANLSKLHPGQVARVVNECGYADWLFLYYLAKNMSKPLFETMFQTLADEMEKRELPAYNQCPNEGAVLPAKFTYNNEVFTQEKNPME